MTHIIANKSKITARVRRIAGQVEAIERALEAELGCAEILQLVASVRGAMNGLTAELMEDHVRHHIVDAANDAKRQQGADELMSVIRTYLK